MTSIVIDQIIRSSRKTLSIEINRQGLLIVRAPLRLDHTRIEHFVQSKSEWINRHQVRMRENQARLIPENHVYPLAKKEWTNRYKFLAYTIIQQRAQAWARQMEVVYENLDLSNAKTRWGSCSSRRRLRFNWRLIFAPLPIIDYLIVHELAHLKQMNHSSKFWAEVRRAYPEYKKADQWLKQYGQQMNQF